MSARAGKEKLAFWLEEATAGRFRAVARIRDGGVSQALTRMVGEAIGDSEAVAPRGVGRGLEVGVRFRDEERAALDAAARARGTTPANWLRSLALVHLLRRPQWNREQLAEFRAIATEIRAIGNNLNQVARVANAAALEGQFVAGTVEAAEGAVDGLRVEMRRLVSFMSGEFDYWGLPDEQRPTGGTKGGKMQDAREAKAKARAKAAPRKRPTKFAD